MNKGKGNALVGQSGGPTAAINASLAGVYLAAKQSDEIEKIYGMRNGIEGFLAERLVDLDEKLAGEGNVDLLCRTPSSYLGSCRMKLPEWQKDEALFEKAFALFEKYNIRYFFYIGGNDSMDTVMKFTAYAREKGKEVSFIGVPKTVDNDLLATDHTPGYGSAAKFIATTLREISRDSQVYCLKSVTVVEIMGRDAGWLTAASALAREKQGDSPDLIYLPEVNFSFDQYIADLKVLLEQKNNIIVAVSEGVHTADGKYVCESAAASKKDAFGHTYLGGTANILANYAGEKLHCKTRGIEVNVPQRAAGHLLSETDIREAVENGKSAVHFALNGEKGVMVAYERVSEEPYRIEFRPLDIFGIANQAKTVPLEWINAAQNDVTEEFVRYAKPLIQGEFLPRYENGVPKHLILED